MSRHLLFVYGTLRNGGVNDIRHKYPGAAFVGEASVGGRLYDMGGYPAIVPGTDKGMVVGEVYEIDESTLAELDEFEATADYSREACEIMLNGDPVSCWTYRPGAEKTAGKRLIERGDWLEYARGER